MINPNYTSTGSARAKSDPSTDSYDAIKGDVASLAESVKKLATDQMGPAVSNAQDQVKQKIGDVETAIRKNPTQAALIAAGLGFVVGLVLSR